MSGLPGTIHEWVTFLDTQDVPVLRRTIRELDRLRPSAERLTASQLAVVILRDPLMTLQLLRLANSARRGRLGTEITSVEHAIMMLGAVPMFRHFSSLIALEDMLAEQPAALNSVLQVYSRSLHAAYQARQWAIQHQDIRVEEVYIAALLHDMSNIMLWIYAPQRAQEIRDAVRCGRVYYSVAHERIMGFSVADFRLALAAAWYFPEMLAELVDCRNAGIPRAQGVLLGVSIAHLAERGWHGAAMEATLEAMAENLNLPLEVAVWLVHQTAVAAARHWEWYGVPPAAAWLPMLPGRHEDDCLPEPEPEREAVNEVKCLMPDPVRLQQIMDEISAHLDGSLDLHEMMTLVLQGMHEGIALDRIVFSLISRDRAFLKAKYVHGASPDSPLRQFEVDLRSSNLFVRLLEKMQGVWFSSANANTLAPMIPPEVFATTGAGEFFAMSIFIHGKPVGLFYADRKHGECGLDERSYIEFKKLCVRAADGLAHLARK
ncbi:MAG: HDOD domain-containing protein [Sulfurimicrobium sp.]|nr:HDOD domain-containing protein [Sulfurimicrobium sp.]MDP2200107.1 HDOD domain-containing protein [Sulfurimicrobium sp.]MDP3687457.1 HDOD domain-containing protein [Sulfurimicrobium sp.]